jgi:ATP-dependent DNA helicase RecG
MGNMFAISGQVSPVSSQESGDGGENIKFAVKEKTLEMMDLAAFQRLPRASEYLKPLYPQKSRATSQSVSQIVSKMLERVETMRLANPIPRDIREVHGIARYDTSIVEIHRPRTVGRFKHSRSSLAFHELFFMQLRLLCRSSRSRQDAAAAAAELGGARQPLDLAAQAAAIESLAFPLTGDQQRALDDINGQLASSTPSSILLQGDVGCGKTIVALLAAFAISSNGQQVALMAPTEVLAEQHLKSLESFCASLSSNLRRPSFALLTGSTKPAERRVLLDRLASGDLDILVGTHALISAPVQFMNLGLAIVDEQHKFGVEQRAALLSKATPSPHMLTMSATPIPRSLALVLYGEMELIEIQEMPPGRTPVSTSVWVEDDADVGDTTRERLVGKIKSEIDSGGKCFIVCPLIDKGDKGDKEESSLRTAVSEQERLCATEDFSDAIGLLHGRMSSADKERILNDFANPDGTIKVLISTTVVEVGVNVPDATLMIIEHADRFGLAQLHQLRGRVGRGARQSSCILVTSGDGAADRLRILEETNNGFIVAEADLENRGSGTIIGTEQAGDGVGRNHLWELPRDAALVSKARKAAAEFLADAGPDEAHWPKDVVEAMRASFVDLDMSSLPDYERLIS